MYQYIGCVRKNNNDALVFMQSYYIISDVKYFILFDDKTYQLYTCSYTEMQELYNKGLLPMAKNLYNELKPISWGVDNLMDFMVGSLTDADLAVANMLKLSGDIGLLSLTKGYKITKILDTPATRTLVIPKAVIDMLTGAWKELNNPERIVILESPYVRVDYFYASTLKQLICNNRVAFKIGLEGDYSNIQQLVFTKGVCSIQSRGYNSKITKHIYDFTASNIDFMEVRRFRDIPKAKYPLVIGDIDTYSSQHKDGISVEFKSIPEAMLVRKQNHNIPTFFSYRHSDNNMHFGVVYKHKYKELYNFNDLLKG